MQKVFCLSDNVVRGEDSNTFSASFNQENTYKNVMLDGDHCADLLQPGRRLCQSFAKKKSDQQRFTVR